MTMTNRLAEGQRETLEAGPRLADIPHLAGKVWEFQAAGGRTVRRDFLMAALMADMAAVGLLPTQQLMEDAGIDTRSIIQHWDTALTLFERQAKQAKRADGENAMTRPIGIDAVLEERRAHRQEKQARIAARRTEIITRLSPSLAWSRWRETALALRHGIAQARRSAGLTQAEAGLLVGVSLRTYRDYEAAKTDMPSAKVIQLAALLGVTVTVSTEANGQNTAHSERPADAGDGSHDAAAGPAAQEPFAARSSMCA